MLIGSLLWFNSNFETWGFPKDNNGEKNTNLMGH